MRRGPTSVFEQGAHGKMPYAWRSGSVGQCSKQRGGSGNRTTRSSWTISLACSSQGFLPEELDQWVQDSIYPSYSPTVLLFLGFSSLYGLFKVGKLPGQKQI